MALLPIPLTMYVARHSQTSIAKQKQIPISVISDAIGHDSEKTTHIYLSTPDTSAMDSANSEILAAQGNGNQLDCLRHVTDILGVGDTYLQQKP